MGKKLPPLDAANAEIARLKALISTWRSAAIEACKATDSAKSETVAVRAELAGESRRHREAEEDRNFLRLTNRALELRLERAKGYIDRIVEREEADAIPEFRHEPNRKPPIGPSLNDIEMPTKNAPFNQYANLMPGERMFGRRY